VGVGVVVVVEGSLWAPTMFGAKIVAPMAVPLTNVALNAAAAMAFRMEVSPVDRVPPTPGQGTAACTVAATTFGSTGKNHADRR